jgi:hypothetical protein
MHKPGLLARWKWIVLLAAAVAVGDAAAQNGGMEYNCPVLDSPYRTSVRTYRGFSLGYLPPAESSTTWGEVLQAETSFGGELGFWENEVGGDLLLQGLLDAAWLSGDGPDESWTSRPLTIARFSLLGSQRFVEGWGLQVEAQPGLYTGFETLKSEDFGCPIRGQLIKALSADFALFAGVSYYPRFETMLDPVLGLAYLQREWFNLVLAYPETRVAFGPPKGIRLAGGAKMSRWPQYNLGDDDREFVTLRDVRLYGGLELGQAGMAEIVLRGGYVFEREIEFGDETQAEIEDAPFFQIGVNWLY